MSLKRSIFTALLAAMLCTLSPIAIPFGPLPLSLATFGVALVALLGDRRAALMSVLLYVGLGAVGLPVFAGFAGGAQVLVGPTGGYLFGYIPMTLAIGAVRGHRTGALPTAAALLTGLALCYGFGLGWYVLSADVPLGAALAASVVPFLLPDLVKLAAAAILASVLRRRLGAILSHHENGEES